MSPRITKATAAFFPPLLVALLVAVRSSAAAESGPVNVNASSSPSPALQTYRFQQGVAPTAAYAGAADVELREQSPSVAFGGGPSLTVDGVDATGNRRHVLLRWDIGSLPSRCATITSATVTLQVTNASVDSYEYYPILAPWSEEEATWLRRSAASVWQAPGALGVRDSAALVVAATQPSSTTGVTYYPLNAAGVALLQAWKDGTQANYGVGLIIRSAADDDGLSFASQESLATAARPALTITCRGT